MSEPTVRPPGGARVAVVGSVNIDHIVRAHDFPLPGETVLGISHTTAVGGKGANQAAAAARFGAEVHLVAQVGADDDAAAALGWLRECGVDVSGVGTSQDADTGTAWITVCGGENTIVVVPGANGRWPPADHRLGRVADAEIVLAQLEVPVEVVRRAALLSGTFVLNAAPAKELPDEVVSRCDVLIVNESELATLTGTRGAATDHAEMIDAQRSLLARGAKAVVATLGADGALLATPHRVVHQPALATRVLDTTGAGDAFCGVFAAELARGGTLEQATRCGVAAGSLAVQHATAQMTFDRWAVDAAMALLPRSIPK